MPLMPRKARPKQAGVDEAIQKIDTFRLHRSLSILSLSKLCRVSQPALARFLSGQRKTMTITAHNVLKYIDAQNKQHNWHNRATIPNEIEDAVRSLWDGRPQSADLVASLIRALKPVLELAAMRTDMRNGEGAT